MVPAVATGNPEAGDLSDIFGMQCKKPRMMLHNLLQPEEVESCCLHLTHTPILGFCTNLDQVHFSAIDIKDIVLSLLQLSYCCSAFNASPYTNPSLPGGLQAVHELRQGYPHVSDNSGGIKALKPEDLLPYVVGDLVRGILHECVHNCMHHMSA